MYIYTHTHTHFVIVSVTPNGMSGLRVLELFNSIIYKFNLWKQINSMELNHQTRDLP